jgi:hypothetical protein
MPSSVLYFGYLAVMAVALACFLQAFRRRLETPVHKRWGILGTCLSLGAIALVIAGGRLFGWEVEVRLPWVVAVHRKIALGSTALLILTAVTGALRHRLHRRLYVVFLPVFIAALLTAMIGYRP